MSDYATRINQLAERRQKLLDEENRLIERRKKEIGTLAERFHLLSLSDEVLAGLFAEAEKTIDDKNTKTLERWAESGRGLLQGKQPKPKRTPETESA